MSKITPKELELVRAIYAAGGDFAERLKAKCNWEQMTPVGVLREGWFDKEVAEFEEKRNRDSL